MAEGFNTPAPIGFSFASFASRRAYAIYDVDAQTCAKVRLYGHCRREFCFAATFFFRWREADISLTPAAACRQHAMPAATASMRTPRE